MPAVTKAFQDMTESGRLMISASLILLRQSPWWSLCTLYLSHVRWSYRRRFGSLLLCACYTWDVNCSSVSTINFLCLLLQPKTSYPVISWGTRRGAERWWLLLYRWSGSRSTKPPPSVGFPCWCLVWNDTGQNTQEAQVGMLFIRTGQNSVHMSAYNAPVSVTKQHMDKQTLTHWHSDGHLLEKCKTKLSTYLQVLWCLVLNFNNDM